MIGIEWVKTEASKEDVIRLVDDRKGRRLLVNFKRAGNITNRHSLVIHWVESENEKET